MIGNKIKYRHWFFGSEGYTHYMKEGIVVDAFTEVSGSYKSESFLGIGEGKGSTESKRMYKVELTYEHTKEKFYEDVKASNLVEILEFKAQPVEEEKFIHRQ